MKKSDKTRKRLRDPKEEEGRPMREPTSLFMSPNGTIYSDREGRLPKPGFPSKSPVHSPHSNCSLDASSSEECDSASSRDKCDGEEHENEFRLSSHMKLEPKDVYDFTDTSDSGGMKTPENFNDSPPKKNNVSFSPKTPPPKIKLSEKFSSDISTDTADSFSSSLFQSFSKFPPHSSASTLPRGLFPEAPQFGRFLNSPTNNFNFRLGIGNPVPSYTPPASSERGLGRGKGIKMNLSKPLPAPKPSSTQVDENGDKIYLCPACSKGDDGSSMICCDDCEEWYHWVCLHMVVPPDEESPWYCDPCLRKW